MKNVITKLRRNGPWHVVNPRRFVYPSGQHPKVPFLLSTQRDLEAQGAPVLLELNWAHKPSLHWSCAKTVSKNRNGFHVPTHGVPGEHDHPNFAVHELRLQPRSGFVIFGSHVSGDTTIPSPQMSNSCKSLNNQTLKWFKEHMFYKPRVAPALNTYSCKIGWCNWRRFHSSSCNRIQVESYSSHYIH